MKFAAKVLSPKCNARMMVLRGLSVIFVEILCKVPDIMAPSPKRPCIHLILQMIRIGISVGEAEQGVDAFRGRGVAAKKTHWVILERGDG